MGFSSMVRGMARVVVLVAITSFSLQAACALGIQPLTSVQDETHGNSGCHESVPPAPQAPAPRHVCCSGDHLPDALLSVAVTPTPLVLNRCALRPTLSSCDLGPSCTDFPAAFSLPQGPFSLRI